jgi:hypothetical protein
MDESIQCAALGVQIELELLGDEPGEAPAHLTLVIVPDDQADFYAGFLGEGTPLAQALLGRRAGDVVNTPAGQAHILALRQVEQGPRQAKENAARRQEALEQTQKEIARTNAIVFSTTVEGKWGDYDPDGIDW